MISLKLKRYKNIEFSLAQLVAVFNDVTLNATAAGYVNGMPITDIETDAVLRQHKYDKASTLPNFTEYQNMGIDLSVTMPDCSETKAALDSLVSLVADYAVHTQFKDELKYIIYDKKTKQFAVSQAGKQALDNAVVTLTGKEEAAYNAIYAAHAAILDANPKTVRKFFSEDVMNTFTNTDLRPDDLVYYLMKKG